MFNNRSEAGKLLASKLRHYHNKPGVILAVPRGGVPVAFEVAKELNLPLEIILVKKLGHPLNKEYAIGAVGLKDRFLVPHQDVSQFYIDCETENVRNRLLEMQHMFLGDKKPAEIEGKTVIVIDDGIATGNTLFATLKILKKSNPAKIIVAAPVISYSAAQKLKAEVAEVVAVIMPESFLGIGSFYRDFTQVTDAEVLACLQELNQTFQST